MRFFHAVAGTELRELFHVTDLPSHFASRDRTRTSWYIRQMRWSDLSRCKMSARTFLLHRIITGKLHAYLNCLNNIIEPIRAAHHGPNASPPPSLTRDGSLGVPREVLPHGLLVLDRASLSLNTDPIIVNQLSTLFDEKDRDDRGQFERKR